MGSVDFGEEKNSRPSRRHAGNALQERSDTVAGSRTVSKAFWRRGQSPHARCFLVMSKIARVPANFKRQKEDPAACTVVVRKAGMGC